MYQQIVNNIEQLKNDITNLENNITNLENNLVGTTSNLQNNQDFLQEQIINLNLEKQDKNLIINLGGYYIGNFSIYKINSGGTFDVEISNNRIIEIFRHNNIVAYFFRGIYDESNNSITNAPLNNIQNIGYINIENNIIKANIRAGEDAGKGATETWYISDDGTKINSYYSINGNLDNNPVLWVGNFTKFNL